MTVRLSVNVNDETAAAIREIGERRGDSAAETIRRAVALLDLADTRTADGWTLQVARGDVVCDVVLLPPAGSEAADV